MIFFFGTKTEKEPPRDGPEKLERPIRKYLTDRDKRDLVDVLVQRTLVMIMELVYFMNARAT